MVRQRDLVRGVGQGLAPAREPSPQVPEPGAPAPPIEAPSRPEGAPPQGPGVVAAQSAESLTAIHADQARASPADLHAADPLIQRAVDLIEGILQAVSANASFSIVNAREAAESLLRSLESGEGLLAAFFSASGPSPTPARQAVHVSILSVKMGMELRFAPEKLRNLGLAALLWDAGMARVPVHILGKRGELTPNEQAVLENAQRDYAKLIQAQGPEHGWLAELVGRRYEQGKGPRQPESETEEYLAIIRLAEIAERLVHHRPVRPGVGSLDALKKILVDERAAFPDSVLKAMIRVLSTFPEGSLVILNTGEIGRVVAKNRDFPLRPVVEMLVRQGKSLTKPVVIDLSRSPLHHIQDSFLEEALP